MPRRPLAVVLHDAISDAARPDERDNLIQVEQVSALLKELGLRVERMPVGLDLTPLRDLAGRKPDLVFNLVESIGGHGRLIPLAPAVLAAIGVSFTGADESAMLVTSNKLLAKRLMAASGVPTPAWIEHGGPASARPDDRYIVKSVWEDASLGIDPSSVVALSGAGRVMRDRAARFGGEWFAERYIEGREVNVSLLDGPDGPVVLPLAEIVFADYAPDQPRIVDYRAKWDETSREYHATGRCFDTVEPGSALDVELRRLALICWRLFGLKGYARTDFRIDTDGRPFVLEVNANPCLSADAGFMAAAAKAGLEPRDVIVRIAAAARPREKALVTPQKPRKARSIAGVSWRDEARLEDVEAVRALVAATGMFSPAEIAIAAELVEDRLKRGAASDYLFLFAEEGGTMLGYSCYGRIDGTKASFDLYWIAVDPALQSRGLGAEILRRSEDAIAADGGARVYVDTSSSELYVPTRSFYERNGYTKRAELPDFYKPGDGKTIYEKAL